MDLAQELQTRTRAYVEGQSSLAALRGWLEDHALEIAGSQDAQLRELEGFVWILLSEWDLGHRGEESVRAELAQQIPAPSLAMPGIGPSVQTVAHTAHTTVTKAIQPAALEYTPSGRPPTWYPVNP